MLCYLSVILKETRDVVLQHGQTGWETLPFHTGDSVVTAWWVLGVDLRPPSSGFKS